MEAVFLQAAWLMINYKMKKNITTLLILFFCGANIARAQVLLLGQVIGDSLGFVRVYIDNRYIDGTETTQTAMLNSEGKFGFSLPLHAGQIVVLEYQQRRTELYLAPKDTLILTALAEDFPARLRAEGVTTAVAAYNTWQLYRQKYPIETDAFNVRQYRRGIFYYEIQEGEDKQMQSQSPETYLKNLREAHLAKKELLFEAAGSSAGFRDFLRADIDFDYYYRFLAYGHVYKGRWQLELDTFLRPMQTELGDDFSAAYIHNRHYRRFALAYTYWQSEKQAATVGEKATEKIGNNLYQNWYFTAAATLHGLSRATTLAAIVAQGLRREEPAKIALIYKDFLENNTYWELDKIVAEAGASSKTLAVGTPAPLFSLPDSSGRQVALRDFVGKYVYIDFWASWCRPCIKKMNEMPAVEAQFAAENIVFLHINLDKDPLDWQKTLRQHQWAGRHLHHSFAAGVDAAYQVYAVPKYFLISPEGNFIYAPPTNDLQQLSAQIAKLFK